MRTTVIWIYWYNTILINLNVYNFPITCGLLCVKVLFSFTCVCTPMGADLFPPRMTSRSSTLSSFDNILYAQSDAGLRHIKSQGDLGSVIDLTPPKPNQYDNIAIEASSSQSNNGSSTPPSRPNRPPRSTQPPNRPPGTTSVNTNTRF